jgi:small-conductance mechanosensitive channel
MMRVLSALVFLWLSAFAAVAQAIDFAEFDRFAGSVETSLANERLPDSGFEALRASLVEWRETMLDGQDANAVQIEALEAQLDALGPVPAEGETEEPGLAARRAELREALQAARSPQLSAVEGFARADALIRQIDAIIRARQTDALLEMRRTPLDPTLWPPALGSLAAVVQETQTEVVSSVSSEGNRTRVLQRLAIAALLFGLALFLIFRGPRWIENLLSRIEAGTGVHGPTVYGFLVSFAGVVVAVLGVSLINAALISTGILGSTGRAVAIGVNAAIVSYAVGRWLGGRMFPERQSIPTALRLDDRERTNGRRLASSLGLLSGLFSLQAIVHQTVDFNVDTLSVLMFPVFVLLGIVLFRLGRLVRLGGSREDGEQANFGSRVIRLLGGVVQFLAIAAPVLAAIGFFNLARGILYPLTLTLGLIAFLMALHYVLRAGFALLRGLGDDEAKEALTPVLLSLGATLCALPAFALIWGARNSDLGEVWSQFKTGIRLGDATISPGNVLTLAVVFAIGFGLTRLVQGTLRSSVLPRTKMDKGGQNAIVSGVGYVGMTIAALVSITAAGLNLSSFAIVIGALGVGIGFGLQNIVNNFVSGIILLIERPIGEGDWVEVNGQMGIVKAISVRSTRIETFDRTDVIVPNGDLISGTVTNWTRGNSIGRVIVPVGVAYGNDTQKVAAILKEIADDNPLVAVNPPPNVIFQGFGADSMDFEIRAILTDISFGLSVKSAINHEIARRFTEEGIEIPFAQRDIWIRNPETLTSGEPGPEGA